MGFFKNKKGLVDYSNSHYIYLNYYIGNPKMITEECFDFGYSYGLASGLIIGIVFWIVSKRGNNEQR